MQAIKLTIALLLLGAIGTGNAWADYRGHHGGGRAHFGVVIGPYWGPSYYPYPYYYPPYYQPSYSPYYPPVVVERQAPQVYIEQQPPAAVVPPAPVAPAASAPASYWYYCAVAGGYYPYVKECPSGWQRVLPQPPGQQ